MTEPGARGAWRRCVVPATHFMVMLDDEIYRAERYGIAISLILADAPGTSARSAAYLDFAAECLRRIDLGTTLRSGLIAICLPHTRSSGAQGVGMRLREALPGAVISIVTFPEDGRTAEQLLNAAECLLDVRKTIGPALAKPPAVGRRSAQHNEHHRSRASSS